MTRSVAAPAEESVTAFGETEARAPQRPVRGVRRRIQRLGYVISGQSDVDGVGGWWVGGKHAGRAPAAMGGVVSEEEGCRREASA